MLDCNWHPPLPLQFPTPCNPPPPPRRLSLPCFSSEHLFCWFVLPICLTHGLALLSHYFKSITCVCSVIFSLQRRCMGVLCCYFRPKMFSAGDRAQYHPYLSCKLNMCNRSKCVILIPSISLLFLWIPHNICFNKCYRGSHWHIGDASTKKSLHLCSLCLHQWRVPQFALKYPCNPPPPPGRPLPGNRLPPPPTGRPSRANGGDCKGGGGYIEVLQGCVCLGQGTHRADFFSRFTVFHVLYFDQSHSYVGAPVRKVGYFPPPAASFGVDHSCRRCCPSSIRTCDIHIHNQCITVSQAQGARLQGYTQAGEGG